MQGIYVLIIHLPDDMCLPIGSKGQLSFPAGLYAYVGSGQKAMEKRLKRHLRRQKKSFWHIDYLLSETEPKIKGIFYLESDKSMECKVAGKLQEWARPVPGFGCSDCRCISHLYRFLQQNDRVLELFFGGWKIFHI